MDIKERLMRLEKDLQLIVDIKNVLVSGMDNSSSTSMSKVSSYNSQEIPERDSPTPRNPKSSKQNDHGIRKKLTTEVAKEDAYCVTSGNNLASKGSKHDYHEYDADDLSQKLQQEIAKRADIEDAARQCAIKLRKIEDDLQRERETKRHLLTGTLELKNLLQGYESTISKLESDISTAKIETAALLRELETCKSQHVKTKTESDSQVAELEKLGASLSSDNKKLADEVQNLSQRYDQLQQDFSRNEKYFQSQHQEVRNQLSDELAKNSKIHNDNVDLSLKLEDLRQKLLSQTKVAEATKADCNSIVGQLRTELADKAELMQNLEKAMREQKVNVHSQLASSRRLISKTKGFILSLKNDKTGMEIELQELKIKYGQLHNSKELLEFKLEESQSEVHQFKDRLGAILQQNLEKNRQDQHEQKKIASELKNLRDENEYLRKNKLSAKEKLSSQAKLFTDKVEPLERQIENLKSELQNTKENFQILQKISTDQGQSISKQRGEIQTIKNSNEKLSRNLTESEESEKVLCKRLADQEFQNHRLTSQINNLEDELREMETELRNHDCDQFSDSSWKSKFYQLEKQVEGQRVTWERSVESFRKERDLAVAAARKSLRLAEETKFASQTKMDKVKSLSTQEVIRVEQEKHQVESEKSKKINQLEMELMKIKQIAGNMQRAYQGKVQHLQTALNACIGPFGGNTGFSFNPDLNGDHSTGFL